jgi:hypothetical protein
MLPETRFSLDCLASDWRSGQPQCAAQSAGLKVPTDAGLTNNCRAGASSDWLGSS